MSTIAVNSIIPSTGSTVSIDSFVPAGQFSLRNKIINGDMNIAQRGTSFAAIATGAYSLDRWKWENTSTAVVTASQQSDVPSSNEFQSSLRIAVTTADTSIAAGDVAIVSQFIEGYNVRDLIGKTFTLSFWVRSSKTGTHCVSFRNSVADRSYVVEYTINAANTWEFKTITVSGGLITAGTWNWTNGLGLPVSWALAAGTNFHTAAGSWQSGNFNATANQVNCLDSNTNIFAITGVQLEVGAVATPFEHRPIGTELALCQRYFYQINLSLAVSSIVSGQVNGNKLYAVIPLAMRAAPTPTYNAININDTSVTNAVTAAAVDSGTKDVISFNLTSTGLTSGRAGVVSGTTGAYLAFSAEL